MANYSIYHSTRGRFHHPSETEYYLPHPKSFFPLSQSSSYLDTCPATHFPSRSRSPYISASSFNERHPAERLRYNYGVPSGEVIISTDRYVPREHYSQRDSDSRNYLNDSLSIYAANLALKPDYGSLYSRPYVATQRRHGPFRDVEHAVENFNNFKRRGADSQSYYKPAFWQSKKEDQWRKGIQLAEDGFSYYNSKRNNE